MTFGDKAEKSAACVGKSGALFIAGAITLTWVWVVVWKKSVDKGPGWSGTCSLCGARSAGDDESGKLLREKFHSSSLLLCAKTELTAVS